MEPCKTRAVNERKQIACHKETEYNLTQRLQLIYTDILGLIYPKSPETFRYIHRFSDQYTTRLAAYYSEHKSEMIRMLEGYHNDLAFTNGKTIQRL